GPKCFLAACVMAFCSVSTRTSRSMPLSLATWSRIMFRFKVGTCCCGAAMFRSLSDFFCCGCCLALVVPGDERRSLPGEEEVLQRAGRILGRHRPGRRDFFGLAIHAGKRDARLAARG